MRPRRRRARMMKGTRDGDEEEEEEECGFCKYEGWVVRRRYRVGGVRDAAKERGGDLWMFVSRRRR